MKTISEKENQIVFTAEVEESLANAIRRYINQIPVLAVDELEIQKNDSVLYDETIAHRVGLIPLKTKKKITDKTTGELKIEVKKEGLVYSGELQGDIEVVYDKIPITLLDKGQEIKAIGFVKAGKGNEHSKFSSGLMFYRNITDLKIDKDCPQEVVEACPKKILKSNNGKIIVEDNEKCDMCEACLEVCHKKGKESIKFSPTNELMITVESFGQMSVQDIFAGSIEALKKDLEEVAKMIGN